LSASTANIRERELVIERIFDAPRELVFDAWTKIEYLVCWWGPDDFTVPICELDFRVGGKYRFCMRSRDGVNHWVSGEYKDIVKPEMISFTWKREQDDGVVWCSNNVTVRFDEADEKTKFSLRQSIFETTEFRDDHRGGWSQCLGRLGNFVQELKQSK
jgi:uncharacterized protein YndB with AHSA1/START domain